MGYRRGFSTTTLLLLEQPITDLIPQSTVTGAANHGPYPSVHCYWSSQSRTLSLSPLLLKQPIKNLIHQPVRQTFFPVDLTFFLFLRLKASLQSWRCGTSSCRGRLSVGGSISSIIHRLIQSQ